MINIPNAIIKDIASYVVIDTTSPLYKPKACVVWEATTLYTITPYKYYSKQVFFSQ